MSSAGRPDARTHERRWLILGVLCVSLLVIVLDNFILNVAIPKLVSELHTGDSDLQWIVDAYTITFACLLLTAGSLGDRYGRRGGLQLGLTVFGLGSLASALSTSGAQLTGARALMGVGGAFIMPATLSIITEVFPEHERAKAIGIWTSVAGVAVVLGPVVGGLLVEHYYWGSVFLVNLPIVAAGLVAGAYLIPTSRDPDAPPLDLLGAGLSIIGLCSLLYAIIEGPVHGWTDPTTIAAFAIGLAVLGAFLAWELRCRHPMLDPRFFLVRRFSASSGAITVAFFVMFGWLFVLTQFLQFVQGFTPLQAGLRMLPFATAFVVTAPLSERIVRRFGGRITIAAGLASVATGMALLYGIEVDTGFVSLCLRMLPLSIGLGLVMPPATDAVMGSLPLAKAGVGSAVNDTTRELGGALGIAVAGSVVSSAYAPAVTAFFAGSPAPPEAVAQASAGIGRALAVADVLRQVPMPLAGEYADQLMATARQAFVNGLHHTVLVAAAVAGAVAVARHMPARAPEDERAPARIGPPPAPLTSAFRLGRCDRHAGGVRLYLGTAIDGPCPWCERDAHAARTHEWVRAYLDARAEANHWRAAAQRRASPLNGADAPADRSRAPAASSPRPPRPRHGRP